MRNTIVAVAVLAGISAPALANLQVPEPSTLPLLALGVVAAVFVGRHSKK